MCTAKRTGSKVTGKETFFSQYTFDKEQDT